MGTNYYHYEKPPCECCQRPFEGLHIGKSSAGWCFALVIHRHKGILSLAAAQEARERAEAAIRFALGRQRGGVYLHSINPTCGSERPPCPDCADAELRAALSTQAQPEPPEA